MKNTSPTRQDLTLDEILLLAEAGSFGLPDFQRPFSWGPDQVRSLLATVFMGWPAGLILLMEAPPSNFFAVRPLEGLPARPRFRHLILDGQQRITAIAHAFGFRPNANEPAWYLDVTRFEEGYSNGDIEDAFIRKAGFPDNGGGRLLVPIAALRNATEFQRWRDQRSSATLDGSDDALQYDQANRLWLNMLSGPLEFVFPCTVLPANMPLSSVALIFEKLNTAGLSLDTFDLVVAHVYKDGHNLRAVWESELADKPILRHFSPDDPLLAAELVAMVQLGNTRRSGLLSLEAEALWGSWTRAIAAIESAARFLTDRAGMVNASQLPHRGVLLALAGAAYDLGGLDPELDDMLLYWVYSRSLAERFNAAVNTRVVAEYRGLVRAARGEDLAPIQFDRSTLIKATKRANSSTYLAIQAMIRRLNPSDYPDGLLAIPISTEWSLPVSIMGGSDLTSPERALGVVLGSPRTGRLLSSRSLRDTRAHLTSLDDGQVTEYLSSQLLPPLQSNSWDDANRFVTERADLLLASIETLAARSRFTRSDSTTTARDVVIDTEATVDLIRDWLGRTDREYTGVVRLEVGKRVAESLIDQGRPSDAVAALQLLLESPGPRSSAERLGVALLQSRALALSGLNTQAIAILEKSRREAAGLDVDADVAELRPHVAAELGALLIQCGRSAEGVAILWDELRVPSESISLALSVSMRLDYAHGLATMGERGKARRIAQDLLGDPALDLAENFADLADRAERIILENTTAP